MNFTNFMAQLGEISEIAIGWVCSSNGRDRNDGKHMGR